MKSNAALIDLTEKRRRARCEDLLARIRANTPERRPEVRFSRDILWRQFPDHLAQVLAVKVRVELAERPNPTTGVPHG